MATDPTSPVVRHVYRTVLAQEHGEMTDVQLLDRFRAAGEEAAFETLMRRHGPMVLGVCRRVLNHEADAEDAFQATFLVLVRKAASLRSLTTLGPWLHGVARRAALKAREAVWKRRRRERQASGTLPVSAPADDPAWDLGPLLDQELNRLPGKYRAAVVLCDLQGHSRKEAASQLGLPEGTLSGRLTTARRLLAERLRRRGVEPSGTTVAPPPVAELPAALVASTIKAAGLTAAGRAAGVVPASVLALTEGVLRNMGLTKLFGILGALLLGLAALGVAAWAALPTSGGPPPNQPTQPMPQAQAKEPPAAPVGPAALKLTANKTSLQTGELVVFTLAVTNNTDRPLRLDTKPKAELNNGQHVLSTGELLRAVEVKDGKEQLRGPEVAILPASGPGILPAMRTLEKEQVIGAGATKEFRLAARVEEYRPGQWRLLFDDPESPGLKQFGPSLSRSAYFFRAPEGKITFRCLYNRGGLSVSSGDLTLQIGQSDLDGTWVVVSHTINGRKASDAGHFTPGKIVIAAEKMDVFGKGDAHLLPFKIDPTRTPREIDIFFPRSELIGDFSQGIYQLDKDELKLCFPLPLEERRPPIRFRGDRYENPTPEELRLSARPAKFSSEGGCSLYVLRREK
jgi:RNA polymerase sigma factor (sigma-70 family)